MRQWQEILEPQVQRALQQADQAVRSRGGDAVSLEDFLLSLLELPALPVFLRRHGIDLDELTRTIQCEQPLIALPAASEGLSAQLLRWLGQAREIHGDGWLTLWQLLGVLVHSCELLSEKAYVAVLEQIPPQHWQAPQLTTEVPVTPSFLSAHHFSSGPLPAAPLISETLLSCANRLIAQVLSQQHVALWLQCDHGPLARSLLGQLQQALALQGVEGNRECRWCCISREALTGEGFSPSRWLRALGLEPPAHRLLVLDGVTPELWRTRIEKDGLWYWNRLLSRPGLTVILRSGFSGEGHERACHWLSSQFDGALARLSVPQPRVVDVQARLHFHHARLEQELGVQVESAALDVAAFATAQGSPEMPATERIGNGPEADAVLAAAAAALRWQQQGGPVSLQSVENRCRSARQRQLISLARGETLPATEEPEDLNLWRTAEEVHWRENAPELPLVLSARQVQAYLAGNHRARTVN
ncbi:MAG: hypothetical protein EA349_12350 [Halomonadaceae bacterium]|nr:MAG: hypothetical protein EA349_12350 [Halomonadaceae bacterium]